MTTNNNPPQPVDVAGAPNEVWLELFDDNVRGVSVYVPEWYDDSPLNHRLRRIKDNGTRYVRAAQPATTPRDQQSCSLAEMFVESAFAYLNTISRGGICEDRSCIRCRIADAAFEVERTYLSNSGKAVR